MPEISIDRSNLAQTALVYLITLAALSLFGGTLAYWARVWFIPHPQPSLEQGARANVEEAGDLSVINDLFGIAQRKENVTAPSGSEIILFGVVAASEDGRGYAILQVDGKESLAVPEGENIGPGLLLAEVRPEHIVLEHNGMREILALQRKNAPADSTIPPEKNLPVELHPPVITE